MKGSAPPASTYVTPGLQPGAWQHPPISPPVQSGYPAALPPGTAYQQQQQPQRVVVVVNAPNFGKNLKFIDAIMKFKILLDVQ